MKWLVYVFVLVCNWFIFKKMGKEGWEGVIPFYNTYVLFEELYGNGWKFLLLFIPFYNIYVLFKLNIDLANAFNKSAGFGIGLTLLAPIFDGILAFSDAQYGDGSYANTNSDFVTEAGEKVKEFADNISSNTNNSKALDKLKDLADLKEAGVISEEEFEAKKAELLKKI